MLADTGVLHRVRGPPATAPGWWAHCHVVQQGAGQRIAPRQAPCVGGPERPALSAPSTTHQPPAAGAHIARGHAGLQCAELSCPARPCSPCTCRQPHLENSRTHPSSNLKDSFAWNVLTSYLIEHREACWQGMTAFAVPEAGCPQKSQFAELQQTCQQNHVYSFLTPLMDAKGMKLALLLARCLARFLRAIFWCLAKSLCIMRQDAMTGMQCRCHCALKSIQRLGIAQGASLTCSRRCCPALWQASGQSALLQFRPVWHHQEGCA